MSIFSAFKTNRDKEAKGFWFEDVPANEDGTQPGFLLARMGRTNPKFAAVAERVGKQHRRALNNDTLADAKARAINLDLFLDTGLIDWRNVQEEDGTEIPFSRDMAKRILLQLPDLEDVLQAEAARAANFRETEIGDDAKNS